MIQFISIVIYMNSFNEKEKKLLDTLEKLKNFEILTIKNSKEIKLLENKKNQLGACIHLILIAVLASFLNISALTIQRIVLGLSHQKTEC